MNIEISNVFTIKKAGLNFIDQQIKNILTEKSCKIFVSSGDIYFWKIVPNLAHDTSLSG